MKFRKKPVVIEASQWFKNGDHPNDFDAETVGLENGELRTWTGAEVKANGWEGQVVRYYRNPIGDGNEFCQYCKNVMHVHGWIDTCKKAMHVHGWIDTRKGGHIVCPGDWIITGIEGEHYPCKDSIFQKTYEPVTMPGGQETTFRP